MIKENQMSYDKDKHLSSTKRKAMISQPNYYKCFQGKK